MTPVLPKTGPAAVYRTPGVVDVVERAVPGLRPHEVLVEISHCGVCGSDVHLMLDGWGPRDVVQGHEYSGRVVALGDDIAAWAVGDAVVGGPGPGCGACDGCRSRQPSQCTTRGRDRDETGHGAPGGFARYVRADAAALCRVPAGLSLRQAALAEPLAVAMHAITRSAIRAGSSGGLVFGAGPIGALVVAALLAQGLGPVGVVEPMPLRQALARRLGADPVIGPEHLPKTSPAAPEHIVDRPVPVVFECSGKRSAMESGLGMLQRGGQLVLVGAGIEAPTFDPNRILLNELTVTGSFCYDHDGIESALDLLAQGALPLEELVEPDDVPLDGLADVLRRLAAGEIAGKPLVVPTREGRGREPA